MKANGLKQLKHLFIALFCVLSVGVGFSDAAVAATISRPYFKVYGGDVFAGGAFASGTNCDNTLANGYHAPSSPSSSSDKYNGGILSYVKAGTEYGAGSSTNLAGFALGHIKGGAGAPAGDNLWGFYTGYTGLPTRIGNLSFAGPSGLSPWGGVWQGTTAQAHCIPDYFGKQSSPTNLGSQDTVNVSSYSGQNLVTPNGGGILTLEASAPIAKNQRVTIFVDGNVWINKNITYANRSTYDADSVPKFALVARGNIYIDKSVNQLDGVYIAQPPSNISTDKGVIWTCHDKSVATSLDPTYVKDNCRGQLVVNGAFIAAQVILLRSNGNVGSATAGEEATSNNIAEVFNYTPEMVLGGPFFGPSPSNANNIESLISLPPVF